jgi:hypothetical protein
VIRKKYYIDKRCTKMSGSKNAKKPNEKINKIIIYQRTKVQKVVSLKNELINYIKWKPKAISFFTMSCLT